MTENHDPDDLRTITRRFLLEPLAANQAQEEAICRGGTMLVGAGAGSGKTSVLSRRFVRYLLEGEATIDQILTITFTRKAAQEMKERIHQVLIEAVAALEKQPVLHKRAADALAAFDRADISTIDSLCGRITRGVAAAYGVPPDYSPDTVQSTELAAEVALKALAANLDKPGVQHLAAELGLEKAAEALAAKAEAALSVCGQFDSKMVMEKQDEVLRLDTEEMASRFQYAREEFFRILTEYRTRGGKKAVSALDKFLQSELESKPVGPHPSSIFDWCAEFVGVAKVVGSNAKDPLAVDLREIQQTMREIKEQSESLAAVLSTRGLDADILAFIEQFHRELNQARRASGLLSFRDALDLAVLALSQDKGLRRYCQNRWRRVMVDEFQDTDARQFELLSWLCEAPGREANTPPGLDELEAGKLFVVGDEKQSIYRFRGAEVEVFNRLVRTLPEHGGSVVRLEHNFRSRPDIVGWCNWLFKGVFVPSAAPAYAEYEPRWEDARCGRPPLADDVPAVIISVVRDEVGGEFAGQVTAEPAPESAEPAEEQAADSASGDNPETEDDLEVKEQEARSIAGTIARLMHERSIPDGERTRPLRYGDIAILMRSTTNQSAIETALRQWNIPFSTTASRSLFLEAPVNDLYALLQLVVYPEDSKAYAALLRSPLVGFTEVMDADFLYLLASRLPPFDLSLDERLGESARSCFARGRALYQRFCEHAKALDVQSLVWYWFNEEGYRLSLLARPASRSFTEIYDYLLQFVRLKPGENLPEFLDRLRPNLMEFERIPDLSILREAGDAVRLLTIHASKGLEFPVLILAGCDTTPRQEGPGVSPVYWDDEFGPQLRQRGGKGKKLNWFYTRTEQDRIEREHAELKRLFYVAATRAKELLILSARIRTRKSGKKKEDNKACTIFDLLSRTSQIPFRQPAALAAIANGPQSQLGDAMLTQWPATRLPEPPRMDGQAFAVVLPSGAADLARDHLAAMVQAGAAAPAALRRSWGVEQLQQRWLELQPGAEAAARQHDQPSTEAGRMAAWYGTYAHALAQDAVEMLPNAVAAGQSRHAPVAPTVLADCPDPPRSAELSALAQASVRAFVDSGFFTALGAAALECEVPFVLPLSTEAGPVWVHGRMDLVAELPDRVLVIDFKTDSTVRPENHALQMSVYHHAAAGLYQKPAQVWLWYLRHNEAVEKKPLPDLEKVLEICLGAKTAIHW